MQLHANAALSLNQRRRMVRRVVEHGCSLTKAAEAAEVSERTCSKWVGRYRAEGEAGLRDRSSAPRSIPHRTLADRVAVIAALRRLRMTGAEIAGCLGMALSTSGPAADRPGQAQPPRAARAAQPLRAPPPGRAHPRRRQEARPYPWRAGRRVTDSRASQKKTRRNGKRVGVAGREFVHLCVDDATRLAY
jgi:hypothetical protein